jgi:carbohydrate kinase (thermoresistant glucokinase family)
MGVSGSGKSTVGALLAERLNCDFVDGDALHPAANIAKMAAGSALTDDDRQPWLARVGAKLAHAADSRNGMVIACSALRRTYRDAIIRAAPGARFAHLDGAPTLITTRMSTRTDHYMPPSLLDSQVFTLEPLEPDELGVAVTIDHAPAEIVADIIDRLGIQARPTAPQ